MKLVRSQKEGTNWHKSSPLSRWEGVLKRSGEGGMYIQVSLFIFQTSALLMALG